MGVAEALASARQRLGSRADSEHGQAILRIVLILVVVAYFFTDYFAARVTGDSLRAAKHLVITSTAFSFGILIAIFLHPAVSIVRRILGMLHDVAAISASIYFGEGAGAAVAVLYLWITLGNGFRFGVRYLYVCAILSVAGFLIVYLTSAYWRGQDLLTINILLTMLIVPAYVASLLRSLHSAKDALQRQASTDSLTGLLSRMEMETAVDSLFDDSGSNHVLLFCDLDRFKEVNDVAGHAAGDKLLADIGELIRHSVRKGDLCGRMGGDEFCVLLRDCTLERGRQVAEKIRSKMTGYRLGWGTEYFSVGVSIGVAPSIAVNDADSLFRLADAACYAAKNAGRNRVPVVDPRTDALETQRIRQLFGSEAGEQRSQARQTGEHQK